MMPSFMNISSHVWTFRFESFQTPVSSGLKERWEDSALRHIPLSPLQILPLQVIYKFVPLEIVTLFLFCNYFF